MKTAIRFSLIVLMLVSIALPVLAQRQTEVAVAWYNKGAKASDPEEKIRCYKKAIKLVPEFIEAHYYLGHTYKNINDYENAIDCYQKALKSNPKKLNKALRRTILFELGIVQEKKGNHVAAEQTYLNALEFSKENSVKATIFNMLGNISLNAGNFDKAIEYYRKGKEVYPINANSFDSAIDHVEQERTLRADYEAGKNLLAQNNVAEAIEKLERVLALRPNYRDAGTLLDSAKSRLDREFKRSIDEFYNQGLACVKRNDWKGAVEAFDLVATKSPDYLDVQNQLDNAKKNLRAIQRAENLQKLYEEGNVAAQRGDYIKALIAYERVSEIDPNYKNVSYKIQQITRRSDTKEGTSTKSKLYAQAMEAYESNDWQGAYNLFNRLLAIDSNFEDVQQMLEKTKTKMATATREGTIELYYQKGLDYFNQENWLYAVINLEKVHMLNPEYKDVKSLMAQARQHVNGEGDLAVAETGDGKKGSPFLMIGIILSSIFIPFWAMVLFSPTARARFYMLQKRYDKAGQIYERMLKSNPDKVHLYITLANIYINENRQDEYALKVFKKVVDADLSDELKNQLQPIVNRYYLQNSKAEKSSLGMLEDSLREELKRMGN